MRFLIVAATAALGLVGQAHANLVTNGDFETTTSFDGNTTSAGQLGYNINATGWTVSGGYAFLFNPGTADSVGATGEYGNLQLWGPGNGSANGLPTTTNNYINFVALELKNNQAPIQQTLTGLTVGQHYTVSFYWAGAQQYNFNGATTEQYDVSLGGQTQATASVSNATHGFTGWMESSFTYTASATSEVLSFLAQGTPSGEPPFSLLDGVNVAATVPEPTTTGLLASGIVVFAVLMRARARRPATA